jgi:uncharacterized protein (DUF433 family)
MNAQARPQEYWRSRLQLPVYRMHDAAKYAHISTGTVRNWHKPSNRPMVLSRKSEGEALSYLQLIELAVAAAARKAGVSLSAIRSAREYCSRQLGSEFPFAEYRFKTDGKHLWLDYAEIVGGHGTGKLLSTSQQGQLGWTEIIGRLREFEYDRNFGLATRWHVAGRRSPIIIDPRVSFGAPSIDGIPTRLIRGRWEGGEPTSFIADDYDLPEPHVIDALRFEGVDTAAWRKN